MQGLDEECKWSFNDAYLAEERNKRVKEKVVFILTSLDKKEIRILRLWMFEGSICFFIQ